MLSQVISNSRRRFHPVAKAWIDAVEAEDGQALEGDVRLINNQFIRELESANLLNKISSLVVKMSARTLDGALINVISPGSSWINNGFLPGDYNRTTGLIGNGTTKYLNTGRASSADPQNDHSMWTHATTPANTFGMCYMGAGLLSDTGSTGMRVAVTTTNVNFNSRASTANTDTGANAAGLIGMFRSNSSDFTSIGNGATAVNTRTSQSPNISNVFDYASGNGGTPTDFSNHRSCMSAMGIAINLVALRVVVNNYIARITALGL